MKWIRRHVVDDDTGEKPDIEQARLQLDRARANWPLVHHLSGQLRELRERNHLADAIRDSMGGRR